MDWFMIEEKALKDPLGRFWALRRTANCCCASSACTSNSREAPGSRGPAPGTLLQEEGGQGVGVRRAGQVCAGPQRERASEAVLPYGALPPRWMRTNRTL